MNRITAFRLAKTDIEIHDFKPRKRADPSPIRQLRLSTSCPQEGRLFRKCKFLDLQHAADCFSDPNVGLIRLVHIDSCVTHTAPRAPGWGPNLDAAPPRLIEAIPCFNPGGSEQVPKLAGAQKKSRRQIAKTWAVRTPGKPQGTGCKCLSGRNLRNLREPPVGSLTAGDFAGYCESVQTTVRGLLTAARRRPDSRSVRAADFLFGV